MEPNEAGKGYPILPRIGAAVAGAALVCPALALPLTLGCLVALTYCASVYDPPLEAIPELGPAEDGPRRRRGSSAEGGVTAASEDSFPASDPPSWTPVTGTGTRH